MNAQMMTPCVFAQERWKNMALWRNLWTILIFVLGSAVILFLVLSIFLFLRTSWLPGALSTLGTLVTGVSSGWVLKRRGEAVAEESAAFNDMNRICSDPNVTATAKTAAQRLSLIGGIR